GTANGSSKAATTAGSNFCRASTFRSLMAEPARDDEICVRDGRLEQRRAYLLFTSVFRWHRRGWCRLHLHQPSCHRHDCRLPHGSVIRRQGRPLAGKLRNQVLDIAPALVRGYEVDLFDSAIVIEA